MYIDNSEAPKNTNSNLNKINSHITKTGEKYCIEMIDEVRIEVEE